MEYLFNKLKVTEIIFKVHIRINTEVYIFKSIQIPILNTFFYLSIQINIPSMKQ